MSDYLTNGLRDRPRSYDLAGGVQSDEVWRYLKSTEVRVLETTLGETELEAAHSGEGHELVDAPGAGKVLVFLGAVLKYNRGASNITSSTNGHLRFMLGAVNASNQIAEGFIEAGEDRTAIAVQEAVADESANVENKKLSLKAHSALTAPADATLDVYLKYQIYEL